ncbi:MYL6 [Cordylochernes scorpioides]|uniref:MYL6 n=1 Tax=Cordylochernes scorpioides TaxID=51811 RepID=A0ABY6LNE3_9ARAC|nr:MYL6 [Cordylochernes scorpioides]
MLKKPQDRDDVVLQRSRTPLSCLTAWEMGRSISAKWGRSFEPLDRTPQNLKSSGAASPSGQQVAHRIPSHFVMYTVEPLCDPIVLLQCLPLLGHMVSLPSSLSPRDRVSFDAFFPVYQAVQRSGAGARGGDALDEFIEGLRHFDKEGNGYISCAELRHLLTTLGEKLSDEEVDQILAGQEDQHGNIRYEGTLIYSV